MAEKPTRRRSPSKGGRPPYKPTTEARKRVEEMKFCGESDNVIARALGIDPDTLRKHFADELETGHAQRRSEVIGLMFDAARKGNVSAMKRLDEMGRAAGASEALKSRDGSAAAAPVKEGKKAEQQRVAEAVTGKFAPPAQPRIVVNNG